MSDKINVLIFPAEGQNAYELHDALSTCVNIHLIGATSVTRHGEFIFENYIKDVPFVTDDNFIDAFNDLLVRYGIDVIFPTHDTVVQFLVGHSSEIQAKIIAGDKYTAEVCRSKFLTYETFKLTDILPQRYYNTNAMSFPAFAKPDEGQGGVGIKILRSESDCEDINFKEYIVTEYLPGTECTVDCFTDQHGGLLYTSVRTRQRIMAGMSVRGENIETTPEIRHIAETLNQSLHFLGLWYFQIKQNIRGEYKLLEVSTRCAGSMCQTRAQGVNLPLLSVYVAMGFEVNVSQNSYHTLMDRALIGRYALDIDYQYVYIDFDDTITLRDKVNLNTIRFLYQCRNKGKKIVLLTRHEKDLDETLNRLAISKLLFNDIIHLHDSEDRKSQHIVHPDSILIDNAYKEREEVRKSCNIPVFDVDQIEFLLDWRC